MSAAAKEVAPNLPCQIIKTKTDENVSNAARSRIAFLPSRLFGNLHCRRVEGE